MTPEHKHLAGLELLPCPFCGDPSPNLTHDDYVHDGLRPMPVVECTKCHTWVRAEAWNTRAQAKAAPEPVQGEASTLIVERDIFGTMHIKMPAHDGGEPFDFVQVQYRYPYTDNQSTMQLADQIAQLITVGANTAAAKADAELVELLRDISFAVAQDRTIIDARYVILSRIDAALAKLTEQTK